MVNDAFQSIMFFQFCTSLSMICFNFYRIMQIEMDSRYIGTILYMVCSLMQIFYYCWFSNEVKLKVRYCRVKDTNMTHDYDFLFFFFFVPQSLELSDMIFRSNWTSLNNNVQRAILLVMRRSMKPIEFTSIYIVSVNLDSFMTVSIRKISSCTHLQVKTYCATYLCCSYWKVRTQRSVCCNRAENRKIEQENLLNVEPSFFDSSWWDRSRAEKKEEKKNYVPRWSNKTL